MKVLLQTELIICRKKAPPTLLFSFFEQKIKVLIADSEKNIIKYAAF